MVFLGKPRVFRDLFGPFAVSILQRNGARLGIETAAFQINAAYAQEASFGYRHALRFVCQVDGTLLDNAVDVVSPRIVIEQTVNRQLEFIVQTIEQPPHAPCRLPGTVSQQTVVLAPKVVFVKALPNSGFFDVQYELCLAIFELYYFWLDDRRNAIASHAHIRAVDFARSRPPRIHDRDIADQIAPLLCEQMQFFTQRN